MLSADFHVYICNVCFIQGLNNPVPFYLKDLIVPYYSNTALHSQTADVLVVPSVFKSRMQGRAYSVHAPLLWNKIPVWNQETDSLFKISCYFFTFWIIFTTALL